jgi:hypothetical protein
MTDRHDAMAERFKADTANHQMTVLHDDGLYRHLRFNAPDTGCYWFDIVTWPGKLAFTGDMDGFVFSRVEDMFGFFRNPQYGIKPVYWGEKVVDGRDRLKTFDEAKFQRLITDGVKEYEETFPGLTVALTEEMADYATYFEAGAREFLRDFTYRTDAGQRAIDAAEAEWADVVAGGRKATAAQKDAAWKAYQLVEARDTFAFRDSGEWDLTDWDWSFLWACHAIVWGIARYDVARKPVTA